MNEETNIDIDCDGTTDIKATLNEIKGTTVFVEFQYVSELLKSPQIDYETDEILDNVTAHSDTINETTNNKEELHFQKPEQKKSNKQNIIIISLLSLIAISLIIYRRVKRNKK